MNDDVQKPASDRKFVYVSKAEGLQHSEIADIIIDNKDHIWASYIDGTIGEFDGVSWTLHRPAPVNPDTFSGLGYYYKLPLMQDSKGNIWAGVYSKLCKFDGQTWTVDSFPGDYFSSIAEMNNKLWFGGSGLKSFDGHTWSESDFCNSNCGASTYIVADSEDNLWISTGYSTIWKFDGTNFLNFPLPNDEASPIIGIGSIGIAEGANGNIFAINRDGLWKFSNNAWQKLVIDDYSIRFQHHIMEDSQGRLWLSGWSIVQIVETVATRYSLDGFDNLYRPSGATEIVEDRQRQMWVGNINGLWRLEPE